MGLQHLYLTPHSSEEDCLAQGLGSHFSFKETLLDGREKVDARQSPWRQKPL